MKNLLLSIFILFSLTIVSFGQNIEFGNLQPAKKMLNDGKPEQAIAFLDEKIKSFEANENQSEEYFKALYLKSQALTHSRKSEEALALFKIMGKKASAKGLDSMAAAAYLSAASILMFQGEDDSIKSIAEKVLQYKNLPTWQISNSHTFMGGVYNRKNEVEKALYHFNSAVKLDREIIDSSSMPYSCLELGSFYGDIDSQELALKFIIEGYQYLRKGKDEFKKAVFLDRLGEIYMDLGNFYKAEQYVDENLALTEKLGMNSLRTEGLLNKFEILQSRGDLDGAKKTIQIADSLIQFIQSKWVKLKVKMKQFHLDAEINGDYNPKLFNELVEFRKLNDNPRNRRYIDIVELKVNGPKWTEAKFLRKWEELYESDNASKEVNTKISFYKAKVHYYEKNGKWKKAYAVKKELEEIDENQQKLNNQRLISQLETEFQTEQKKREILFLTDTNEANNKLIAAQKNRFLIVSLALGLISLLSFFLWRVYKKTIDQKDIITKALGEKELLLREIHHRVKNNLQLVSSLLTLQGRSIDDDLAQKAIQEGKNRVMSMALIHQDLYNKENLTAIGVKEYLVKLTSELFNTYNISDDKITLSLDIEEMDLDVDTLIPIGLILNELITNSLKYAFSDQPEGKINISIFEKDDFLGVEIIDNGKGYDPSQVRADSFGTTLVNSLVEQLEGEINISNEEGTKILMKFKDYKIIPK